jgi:Family of unknown function (DUF5681)
MASGKKSSKRVDVGAEAQATPQAAAQRRTDKIKNYAIESTRPKAKTGNPNWQKGVSGNPAGRPKGSRNKFSENYIDAMQRAFEERGVAAIHAVIDESPAEFLRLCSAIVPKQFGIEEGTQDCFRKVWEAISDGRAG